VALNICSNSSSSALINAKIVCSAKIVCINILYFTYVSSQICNIKTNNCLQGINNGNLQAQLQSLGLQGQFIVTGATNNGTTQLQQQQQAGGSSSVMIVPTNQSSSSNGGQQQMTFREFMQL